MQMTAPTDTASWCALAWTSSPMSVLPSSSRIELESRMPGNVACPVWEGGKAARPYLSLLPGYGGHAGQPSPVLLGKGDTSEGGPLRPSAETTGAEKGTRSATRRSIALG